MVLNRFAWKPNKQRTLIMNWDKNKKLKIIQFDRRVVEPWNGLDSDIRNCRTNKAFKNKLKSRPGLI